MTSTKSSIRFLFGAALIASTVALTGCGGSDRVTKTTTTDQTTNTPQPQTSSSTTTTTTRQTDR